MNDTKLSRLGKLAAEAAMRGAADFVRKHDIDYDEAALIECI